MTGTTDAQAVIDRTLDGATAPCITCSFQTEDVVVLQMLLERRPDIPVLFLDTFHHFPETIAYRDELTAKWKLNVINLRAEKPAIGLWQTSYEDCCATHKVGPLFAALTGYDVWFTGLRRAQSPTRANLAPVEPFRLPGGQVITKASPVATWTTRDVWMYAQSHGIPQLPLYELGYTSIGCQPCTTLPGDPGNQRSGR